jgi:hypothetical protein
VKCTANCNKADKYQYRLPPVVGYGSLKPSDIPYREDFADTAEWYVNRACDLKKSSKERYNFFKDQIFKGMEYIPAGGCGK